MATRSSISIRNHDGTYTGIYCHWDGYLSNNGRILSQHYIDEAKIRQLMDLGDISSLKEEIGEKHPFDGPSIMDPEGHDAYEAAFGRMTTAYGRDRGEEGCESRTKATLDELLAIIGQEYDYLWDGSRWLVRCRATDGKHVTLDEARRLEDEDR